MLHTIAMGIWRVFPPILLVIGTLGNGMTICILLQRRNRNSSLAKFLSTLAAADLLVLWIALSGAALFNGFDEDIRSYSEVICKGQFYLSYFATQSSVISVVIVTIERLLRAWLPTKVKQICTVQNARKVIIGMVVILLILNVHFLYGMGIGESDTSICYPINESYAHFFFSIWLKFMFVINVSVLVILVTANALIIIRVGRMRKKFNKEGLSQAEVTKEQARKLKFYRVTSMLVTLSIIYLLCVTPYLTFLVFYSDWVLTRGFDHSNEARELIWAVVNALFYSNNASNFILYFLSVSAFRKEAMKIFRRMLNCLTSPCRWKSDLFRRPVKVDTVAENVELRHIRVVNP